MTGQTTPIITTSGAHVRTPFC